MTPNITTNLHEHFPNEAAEMKVNYNFCFRVDAYRKLTKSEMTFAFQTWKRLQKRKTFPKNKTITIQSLIGAN